MIFNVVPECELDLTGTFEGKIAVFMNMVMYLRIQKDKDHISWLRNRTLIHKWFAEFCNVSTEGASKQMANTSERLWEMLKLEIKQGESVEKGNYGGGAYEIWVTEE